jgi:hypothetical protein
MDRISPRTVPKAETLATTTTMAAAAAVVAPPKSDSTEQEPELPAPEEMAAKELPIHYARDRPLCTAQAVVAGVTQRTASAAPTAVTDAAPMQAAPEVHTESTKQAEAAAVDG